MSSSSSWWTFVTGSLPPFLRGGARKERQYETVHLRSGAPEEDEYEDDGDEAGQSGSGSATETDAPPPTIHIAEGVYVLRAEQDTKWWKSPHDHVLVFTAASVAGRFVQERLVKRVPSIHTLNTAAVGNSYGLRMMPEKDAREWCHRHLEFEDENTAVAGEWQSLNDPWALMWFYESQLKSSDSPLLAATSSSSSASSSASE